MEIVPTPESEYNGENSPFFLQGAEFFPLIVSVFSLYLVIATQSVPFTLLAQMQHHQSAKIVEITESR